MTQQINTFQSLNLEHVQRTSNEWIKYMESSVVGFIAINISLSQSVDTATNMVQYSLAILYGIRNTQYTTEELKV